MREGSGKKLRCAVYTRKSSEEGLEQDFNSLEAQREACEAYIRSQSHEGWVLLPDAYDDGGFSGGNMDRPALTRLMDRVKAGAVDVIVIYKIDRLTRSLMDFSRLAETFETHNVSFVSVTQQFNTTTSMGRLMLNVLLSFAQFERELTGERIRDKLAASKKRGMWMGGTIPFGYDARNRALVINPEEAETVRLIFRRYLELGNVRLLQQDLEQRGIRTREVTNRTGRSTGGKPFSRGHLYRLLSNPLYIGEIRHKTERHKGLHEAIIDQELWERIQATLSDNTQGERTRPNITSPHLLAGLLYDSEGNRFTVSHTVKDGKRYRYYVCHPQGGDGEVRTPIRIPAAEIEQVVVLELQRLFADEGRVVDVFGLSRHSPSALEAALAETHSIAAQIDCDVAANRTTRCRRLIVRVDVYVDSLSMRLTPLGSGSEDPYTPVGSDHPCLIIPMRIAMRGSQTKIIAEKTTRPSVDTALLKAVARARMWFDELSAGATFADIGRRLGISPDYVHRIVNLAFFGPALVECIVDGTFATDVTLERLLDEGLPLMWADQEAGFFGQR